MEYITVTMDEYKQLRKAYEKARATGVEVFLFKGKEFLTSYAKYLLEYMDRSVGVGGG